MNLPEPMVEASATLAQSIQHWTGSQNHLDTAVPGLRFSHWDSPTRPQSYTHKPSICLIAQGSKRVILGDEQYLYDANSFLISSVDLPVVANIVNATPEKPYLGAILEIDLQEISQLIVDSDVPLIGSRQSSKGLAVEKLSQPIQNAFIRLIKLLDEPDNIKILAPLIKREIFYRLLTTEQGPRLHQIVTAGNHSQQISKAIEWLKLNYVKSLNVGELANYSGMSKSAFYTHFRAITSMTPLQFQKKLRLNEARRLMLTEHLDALATTFKVGYESPSQFSREYSRLFGAPPATDIKNLRLNS